VPAAPGNAGRGRGVARRAPAADFNPKTYDELVLRHRNPIRRLYVIVCVIILEILQRMAMMDNPALQPLPSTVLARVLAGETFDLPHPLVKLLRLCAGEVHRRVGPPAPQAMEPFQSVPPAPVPAPSPRAAQPLVVLPRRFASYRVLSGCVVSRPARLPVVLSARFVRAPAVGFHATTGPPLVSPFFSVVLHSAPDACPQRFYIATEPPREKFFARLFFKKVASFPLSSLPLASP
jgi:hypothetical protein